MKDINAAILRARAKKEAREKAQIKDLIRQLRITAKIHKRARTRDGKRKALNVFRVLATDLARLSGFWAEHYFGNVMYYGKENTEVGFLNAFIENSPPFKKFLSAVINKGGKTREKRESIRSIMQYQLV